jgi:hypothetical protein
MSTEPMFLLAAIPTPFTEDALPRLLPRRPKPTTNHLVVNSPKIKKSFEATAEVAKFAFF